MSEEVRSIILWLHLLFIAVWIGSQVLTGFAVVPTLRRIESRADRMDLLRAFTRRFSLIAWGSLFIVLITGGLLTGDRIETILRRLRQHLRPALGLDLRHQDGALHADGRSGGAAQLRPGAPPDGAQ